VSALGSSRSRRLAGPRSRECHGSGLLGDVHRRYGKLHVNRRRKWLRRLDRHWL